MRRPCRGVHPTVSETAFVAETAALIGAVTVGHASTVWYGAVLRGDVSAITVGARTSIQDGSVLHGDADAPCVVGDDVTVGHNATVHGCTVGDGAVIGIGATVLSHATVGPGAVVAAGALVREGATVPPDTIVAGVPARPVREVTEADRERFRQNAAHYVLLGREYRQGEREDEGQ